MSIEEQLKGIEAAFSDIKDILEEELANITTAFSKMADAQMAIANMLAINNGTIKEVPPAPPVEPGPKPGPTETVAEPAEPAPTPEDTAGPDEFDDFEPGQDAGPTETVEQEKVDPPKPKVVMALLRRIASEIGNKDAVNLLAEFGAKKFSEVPVDGYADFKSLAEKILGDK